MSTFFSQVYPDSLHAVITCAAGVFPIDILWRPCTGGPISARSFIDIYNQLAQVVTQPSAGSQNDSFTICSLSALERKTWASIREEILGQGGPAAASLEIMESAVLTLCLEDCNAPSELADILNTVRLGGGESPCLRYYDKVVERHEPLVHVMSLIIHMSGEITIFIFYYLTGNESGGIQGWHSWHGV